MMYQIYKNLNLQLLDTWGEVSLHDTAFGYASNDNSTSPLVP